MGERGGEPSADPPSTVNWALCGGAGIDLWRKSGNLTTVLSVLYRGLAPEVLETVHILRQAAATPGMMIGGG
jgi:hypothetical protein